MTGGTRAALRPQRGPRVAVLLGVATLFGPPGSCLPLPPPSRAQSSAGMVYLLPGIQGDPFWLRSAASALRDAGVSGEIRTYDWRGPLPWLDRAVNLAALPRNRAKAAEIAAELLAYREQHPHAPIDLVGYSGGGGLAVFVAEALPPEFRLRHVILAQPALAPEYDLTPALERIDGRLVNLYCPLDWITLGLGTAVFGTVDRAFTPSAGQVGFDVERAVATERLRGRLVQVGWSTAALEAGHTGWHYGIFGYEWNHDVLAPLLMDPVVHESANER